jgi:23S rRNA (uracil-5-)-methyltransferase RumA
MYPEELELTINDMAQGGDGVGRWEGRVVFAQGGLPGERVRVRLHERRSDFARGKVIKVLEASPDRIEPRLPEGGDHMSWQHIDYAAQLRFKRSILQQQLERLGGIPDAPVDEMIPSPKEWGYRNSAHFHVHGKKVGYHAANSRRVVEIAEDPLLMPVLNEALLALRDTLHYTLSDNMQLSSASVRASSSFGYALGMLEGSGELAGTAWRWRSRLPALAGVHYSNPADPRANLLIEGAEAISEEFGGMLFELSAQSFFQVNKAQAENLLRLVREGLDLQPEQRLLDAYSGVGTFALPLSQICGEVVAVEEHPAAVQDGQNSLMLNNISNVQFYEGRVEHTLMTLDGSFDAAVLDPPRRGCHPSALEAILALAPTKIAYVACSPGILARDLKILLREREIGMPRYELRRVTPVDMFPQTPHIECVAVLEQVA